MKLTRKQVYDIIDTERDYQETRWKRPEYNHETGAYLAIMQAYMTKALDAYIAGEHDTGALDMLRKVVAVGVACMEENGGVPRTESMKVE